MCSPAAVRGQARGRARSADRHVDLEAAADAGWLTRATSTGLKPVRRLQPVRPVQDALDEAGRVTLYADTSALLKRYVDGCGLRPGRRAARQRS